MATVEAGQFPAEERRHGQSIQGGAGDGCLLMSRDDVVCVCVDCFIFIFIFYFFYFYRVSRGKSKKTVRLKGNVREADSGHPAVCYYRCYYCGYCHYRGYYYHQLLLPHQVGPGHVPGIIRPLARPAARCLSVCLSSCIAISPPNCNRPDRVMANHSGEHIDGIVSVLANRASPAGRSIYIDRSIVVTYASSTNRTSTNPGDRKQGTTSFIIIYHKRRYLSLPRDRLKLSYHVSDSAHIEFHRAIEPASLRPPLFGLVWFGLVWSGLGAAVLHGSHTHKQHQHQQQSG